MSPGLRDPGRADNDLMSNYSEQTVEDLKQELTDRGLSADGVKAELVERLEADDTAKVADTVAEEAGVGPVSTTATDPFAYGAAPEEGYVGQ